MPMNKKLLNAFLTREIHTSEFLEKSKHLDKVNGAEKVRLQEELAKEIEDSYPYRKGYREGKN